MRRSFLLLAAAGIALGGCANIPFVSKLQPDPGPLPEDALEAAIPYHCGGGRGFTAAWSASGRTVTVNAGGVSRTLPQARSDAGPRYAQGGFEIWGEGDEAGLSGFPGGPYTSCRAG